MGSNILTVTRHIYIYLWQWATISLSPSPFVFIFFLVPTSPLESYHNVNIIYIYISTVNISHAVDQQKLEKIKKLEIKLIISTSTYMKRDDHMIMGPFLLQNLQWDSSCIKVQNNQISVVYIWQMNGLGKERTNVRL